MDISCIVLAGGRGSRLGRNKVQIRVGKRSLYRWVLYRIGFIEGEVIVVVGGGGSSVGPFAGHKVVTDIYLGKGPLGGVFTGLRASKTLYNLVVACDMPFLNQALMSHMIKLAPGFDMVIPRLDGLLEPLHAVFSRSCLAPIEQMIQQDNLSVYQLLSLVKVRYVEADEIDRFDPEHLSFFNVNTKTDLERARELVRRREIIDDKR